MGCKYGIDDKGVIAVFWLLMQQIKYVSHLCALTK